MDPVSLIIAALIAGASSGARDVAGSAIKDAYGALKGLLSRRFGGKQPAELSEPEAAKDRLATLLKEAGADNDEELIRAAQKILALTDPEGARAGKYNVQISGGKGIVVGDFATVHQTFEGD